jgi:hypothetical protein
MAKFGQETIIGLETFHFANGDCSDSVKFILFVIPSRGKAKSTRENNL